MNDTHNDYGSNPRGDGTFEMVPSGDIVDRTERDRRLHPKRLNSPNDIFGMSWDQLEAKQGGKLNRNL